MQVRVLVNELRKQVDARVGELADDLMAEPQHASGDPDALVFRVDQKLLPPAVRPASHSASTSCLGTAIATCTGVHHFCEQMSVLGSCYLLCTP